MKRFEYDKLTKATEGLDKKKAAQERKKQEEERQKRVADSRTPEAQARAAEAKKYLSRAKSVTAKIAGPQIIICSIRELAKRTDEINRDQMVTPWMNQSADALTHGEQPKSGEDFYAQQLGDYVSNFTDESGHTIWQSEGLNALMGRPGGVDADQETKAAFAPDKNAEETQSGISKLVGFSCSTPVLLGTLALQFTGAGRVGSIVLAGKIIVGGVVINTVIDHAAKFLADDKSKLEQKVSGIAGGNGVTLGMLGIAQASGASGGGGELGNDESRQLVELRLKEDKAEFNSKSFAERLFDARDYRSLAGQFIDKKPSSFNQGIESTANMLANLPNLFIPKALAAEKSQVINPYEWAGSKEIGFSSDELKKLENTDATANGEDVVKLVTGSKGSDFIKKAKKCFGAEISQGDGGWDSKIVSDVNTNSTSYHKLNCRDKGNEDWLKIRFFVRQSSDIKGVACLHDDEQACTDLGLTTPESNPGAPRGSETSTAKNSKIYVIGDSLTVGMKQNGLKDKLEASNWSVTDIEATGGITIDNSISKVTEKSVDGAGVVLVGLGTNRSTNPKQQINKMLAAIDKASPGAKVYWINAYSTKASYSEFNNILNELRDSGKISLVADWAKEAKYNPEKYNLAGDSMGIHTGPDGYKKRIDWLMGEIGKGESESSTNTPTKQKAISCEIDSSAAPDLKSQGVKLKDACEENFAKIEELLSPSTYKPPYKLVYSNDEGKTANLAATVGNVVYLDIDFFRDHQTDYGLEGIVVHEDAHVIQGYGYNKAPKWIIEGTADYIRRELGYTENEAYKCSSNTTYLSGYNCSAVFLGFLEKKYGPNLIKNLHLEIKKKYQEDYFERKTGHNLRYLYNECLAQDCEGGKKL